MGRSVDDSDVKEAPWRKADSDSDLQKGLPDLAQKGTAAKAKAGPSKESRASSSGTDAVTRGVPADAVPADAGAMPFRRNPTLRCGPD